MANGMRIKSFFAASVEAAIEDARRELGPEAMLIQSRVAPADARSLGEYEVVCALLPADAEARNANTRSTSSRPVKTDAGGADLSRLTVEIDSLRSTVERLQSTVVRSQRIASPFATGSALHPLWKALLDAEVEPDLARDLMEGALAGEDGREVTSEEATALVSRRIEDIVQADGCFASAGETVRAVALVGPPGAGKTACIARIAARYGVAVGRTTQIIALDDRRVAASEQLRAYAAILGVGFRALEDASQLDRALEDCRWKDLVLIDTPGFSASEEDSCRALANELVSRDSIQTHLALPCSMRAADLRRVCDFYAPFQAQRMIFTRLDETRAYGIILNESARTDTPVSFLTTGQLIPDDIEVADGRRIARLLTSRETPAAFAVAAGW